MEYLIKSSAILIIFFVFYQVFLNKETFFQSNRWFLFTGLVCSIIIPFIVIPIHVEIESQPTFSYVVNTFDYEANQISTHDTTPESIILDIYIIVSTILLLKFLIEILSLFKVIKHGTLKESNFYKYIETKENISPFSFFKWIIYNPKQFDNSELKLILNHEKIHAKQYHSIDILFAEITCIFMWFNPFIWLYKKSLKQNLEFIADKETQHTSSCEATYQKLLLKTSLQHHQLVLANNFYNSLIKKRIVMLQKSKSNKFRAWKYALMAPALIFFLMSFNTKQVFIQKNSPEPFTVNLNQDDRANKIIELIISAEFGDMDLEKIKKELHYEGLDTKIKGVKRNEAGKIIAIKIDIKGNSSNANFQISGDAPIKPVKISYNSDDESISIGSVSSNMSHSNSLAFISEEDQKVMNSDGKHVKIKKIITSEDDENTEVHVQLNTIESVDTDGLVEKKLIYVIDSDENSGSVLDIDTNNSNELHVITSKGEGPHKTKITSKKIMLDADTLVWHNKNDKNVEVIEVHSDDEKIIIIEDSKGNPLYIINGKEATQEEKNKLDANQIKSMNVIKGDKAIKEYGDKAKNGVIEITTK